MTAISTFVFIIMSIVSFIIYKVHNTNDETDNYTFHEPSDIPKSDIHVDAPKYNRIPESSKEGPIFKIYSPDYKPYFMTFKKHEKKADTLYYWMDTDTGETYFCSYNDILRNPKWLAYREKVFQYFNSCMYCRSKESLQIHHNVYFTTKEGYKVAPWCYSIRNISVLCDSCHKEWHKNNKVKYIRLKHLIDKRKFNN